MTLLQVQLDGNQLTVEQVVRVARHGAKAGLSAEALTQVEAARKVVEQLVADNVAVYGVTTGIGELASERVDPEEGSELQRRIIYSHSAGTGREQPAQVVRAAMVARANTLAKGYSGVRLSTLQTYLDILNAGVVPVVYEKGSLGVSGDLSPLSQLAEVVLGEGTAYYQGERLPGAEALRCAGIKPVTPSYKEGLGFINGSQMMTGQACLLLADAANLFRAAMVASAMSLEGLRALTKPLDPRVHASRPHPGQVTVAANLRRLISGSQILAEGSGKVQDGYSLRCTPQVIGPSLEAYHYVKAQVERELNSAADNPLFDAATGDHLAAGNFHGQIIAMAMDFLGIGLAELASLSERHTNRLLNPVLSGLPGFLTREPGLNSGLMVAQYTAAALVSENKVLAHPAVVDSISVSADQEDHVSMGPISVRTCAEIIENVTTVLAVELLCAAQALEFHQPLQPAPPLAAAYQAIREVVDPLEEDRPLHPDIKAVGELVVSGDLVRRVEEVAGELELG